MKRARLPIPHGAEFAIETKDYGHTTTMTITTPRPSLCIAVACKGVTSATLHVFEGLAQVRLVAAYWRRLGAA